MFDFIRRESCPVCSANDAVQLFVGAFNAPPVSRLIENEARDLASIGADYDLRECVHCGLIYQNEVGGDDFLTVLYGAWGTGDDRREPYYRDAIADPVASRDGHEIVTAAQVQNVPLHAFRTLDYGMGWALWARIAAALGCRSHGFDIEPTRMAFAAEHGVLPDDGGRYHFINLDQIVEHVRDPAALVSALAARLEPGGVLKISVPSGDRVRSDRIREQIEACDAPALVPFFPLEHVNCFRRRSMKALAARCRLVEVRRPWGLARIAGTIARRRPRQALKELARPWCEPALTRWLMPRG